jgi:hypothetical protein
MPKIEVSMDALWRFIGASLSTEELERILPYAKAELDGVDEDRGILKIELNDTNRPDLWSTAGLGRQLRLYRAGAAEAIPKYPFFSTKEKAADFDGRIVEVDPALREVRPYIVAFCLSGKSVDDALLTDLIQTQEKLCWNYGRKRKSIAMGVYRNDMIAYPVRYRAADPDATRFVPLGMEKELSLREICREHPKGREFGWISPISKYPFLTDHDGFVLSFPPVINSERHRGWWRTGDANLFVELTGTDIYSLTLAASIVACDAADAGHTILPVRIAYPYDTPFGREVVTPFYFQEPLDVPVPEIGRLLGDPIGAEEAADCLVRMGCPVEIKGNDSGYGSRVPQRLPPPRGRYGGRDDGPRHGEFYAGHAERFHDRQAHAGGGVHPPGQGHHGGPGFPGNGLQLPRIPQGLRREDGKRGRQNHQDLEPHDGKLRVCAGLDPPLSFGVRVRVREGRLSPPDLRGRQGRVSRASVVTGCVTGQDRDHWPTRGGYSGIGPSFRDLILLREGVFCPCRERPPFYRW